MPQGDQTGPSGLGPRTGRGLGFCNGYSVPCFRRGMGRGFGWRRMAFAPVTPVTPVYQEPQLTKEQEKQLLQQELQNIEAETKEIEQEKQEILKKLKELK